MPDIVDYTKASEFLFGHLLASGCQIMLTAEQYEVLKAYLAHIQGLGEDVNFRLERCVDYQKDENAAGFSVCWDNDGTAFQDDVVDTIIEGMTQNLGFDAGSILRPGHIIPLEDIDQHVADMMLRVRDRHNTNV